MEPRPAICRKAVTPGRHPAPNRWATLPPGRAAPRPAHCGRDVPCDRALFLIDLENLLGDPFDLGGVADAMARCLVAGRRLPGDHLIVAGHPHLVLKARQVTGLSFQPLRAPQGPDGADLALLGALRPAFMAERYQRVVIASGDGIFTELAAELGRRGVTVWVVAPKGSTATRLRLAAARVVALAPVSGPVPVGEAVRAC